MRRHQWTTWLRESRQRFNDMAKAEWDGLADRMDREARQPSISDELMPEILNALDRLDRRTRRNHYLLKKCWEETRKGAADAAEALEIFRAMASIPPES